MAEANEPPLAGENARLRLGLENTRADLQWHRDAVAELRPRVARRLRVVARLDEIPTVAASLARRLPVSIRIIGRLLRHRLLWPLRTSSEVSGPAPGDPNKAYLFEPGPSAAASASGMVTLEQLYHLSRSL